MMVFKFQQVSIVNLHMFLNLQERDSRCHQFDDISPKAFEVFAASL
jgi:hypothetical protein